MFTPANESTRWVFAMTVRFISSTGKFLSYASREIIAVTSRGSLFRFPISVKGASVSVKTRSTGTLLNSDIPVSAMSIRWFTEK